MTAYEQGMQYGYKEALKNETALPEDKQNKKFIEILKTLIL